MSTFNLNKVVLNFTIADVSTAGQIYIPIPEEFDGEVVEIRTALNGALTGADATLTPKINDVAITDGAIVIANAGSAAGDVDVSRPTALRTVRVGEAIEIETDGLSTGTFSVFGSVVILR